MAGEIPTLWVDRVSDMFIKMFIPIRLNGGKGGGIRDRWRGVGLIASTSGGGISQEKEGEETHIGGGRKYEWWGVGD